jgi:adenylate cyclase
VAVSARTEPEWAMVTVAFADIRGFTSFADRSTAREALDYLNEFFETIVPIVGVRGGEVNKLLGDGLLAVFRGPDHAADALAATEDMVAAVTGRFRLGVGVNSGLVLIGTMGGGRLTELGVVGDPVNVAARVQDATRDLSEPVLFTEATRCLLEGPSAELVDPRGVLSLRGRREPVPVYAPRPRRAASPVGHAAPDGRHE